MADINEVELVRDMDYDRKSAEYFLLNYAEVKQAYEKSKVEDLEEQFYEQVGGKCNLPGKPTEAKAVRSAQYDEEHGDYLWLKAVDIALRTFGERKHIFISVRREAEHQGNYREGQPGRRAWVVYTQRRYAEEIQKRFINTDGWIGERTVRAWWAQIVNTIVEIHLRLEKK